MTRPSPEDRAVAMIAGSARSRAQLQPLLTRADEALRRSRVLLSLPIYPHDSMPGGDRSRNNGRERS